MKGPQKTEMPATRTVVALSVSPIEEDHVSLRRILCDTGLSAQTGSNWVLRPMSTPCSAAVILRDPRIPIVLSEHELWRKMLEHLTALPDPPLLIVTSRLADDHLWAEALNLGAYDVLAKPFDSIEVTRIVSSALQHWRDRNDILSAHAGQGRDMTASRRRSEGGCSG